MIRHPFSALARVLPALGWLAVFGVSFAYSLRVIFTPGPDRSALVVLFSLGFLAVAIYGLIAARREYIRVLPALRADEPIRIGFPRKPRPAPFVPKRRPMAEALREKLRHVIEALENAGALHPGEVSFEEVLLCAEMDDEYSDIDIYDVVKVLSALTGKRGRPFTNLSFFMDSVEYEVADAVGMVREFARLCGRSAELGAIEVRGIDGGEIAPAPRGTFPPPNAVLELELGGRRETVPFTMYYKNLPMGLMEGLARTFALSTDARRFACGGYDEAVVSYLEPESVPTLNRKLRDDFDEFRLLH